MEMHISHDLRSVLLPGLARDLKTIETAPPLAVSDTTNRIKERLRAKVRVAFPASRKIATAIRGDFYEAKPGKPAAGYVFSAWFKRGRDILEAFTSGRPIRKRDGGLMIVPFGDRRAEDNRARAALERLGSDPRIKIVKTLGGKLYLAEVALPGSRQRRSKLLGRLTRVVNPGKRLDFADAPEQAAAVLEQRLLARFDEARGKG